VGWDPAPEAGLPLQASPHRVVGHNLFTFIATEEDRRRAREVVERAVRHQEPGTIAFLHQPVRGEPFPVEATGKPVVEDGRVVSIQAVLRNTTDRKRAEEALREEREKLAKIAGSAQDAIVMMDAEGNVSFWNQAAETIFGYTADEALGQELHRLMAPDRFRDAYRKGFAHFQQSGEGPAVGRTLDLVARRKNGDEFPAELSLSAVQLRGAWHAIGIVRDVSERKRAEEALPTVQGDRHQLTCVFQNLIGNALKFCDETPRVHLSAERDGRMWHLAVRDNGIGVAGRPIADGSRTVRVTISVGVADLGDTVDPTALLRRVDEALYAAKAAGRNRTCIWTPDGPVSATDAGVPAAAAGPAASTTSARSASPTPSSANRANWTADNAAPCATTSSSASTSWNSCGSWNANCPSSATTTNGGTARGTRTASPGTPFRGGRGSWPSPTPSTPSPPTARTAGPSAWPRPSAASSKGPAPSSTRRSSTPSSPASARPPTRPERTRT